MADNIAITAGSGTTVATDEVGGAHYQYVKTAFGADGTATLTSTSNPLPVALQNLEKAEDAAHTTADKGIMAFAVRNDTAGALAGTDGDYSPLQVNATGDLRVSATLIEKAEDAAHSSGDKGVMGLAVRTDTQASLCGTDGDYAPLQLNATGAVRATMGCEFAEDAAHTTGDKGIPSLAVRTDTQASLCGTDGDYAPLQLNATGAVRATMGCEFAEDAAHTTGDKGIPGLAVRVDTAASLCGTDGDYAPLQMDATGYLRTTNLAIQAEDAAHSSGNSGVFALGVVTTADAGTSATNGDYAGLTLNAAGQLRTAQCSATGGGAVSRHADIDETEDTVKASAGTVYGLHLRNIGTSALAWVHLYDASAPDTAADTPAASFCVPKGAADIPGVLDVDFPQGIAFATAITIGALTTFAPGAVGPGANEIQGVVLYK